jgi:cell division protein FtsB
MNPFEMVVAIIIVVTIGRVLQVRFASQKPAEDLAATSQDAARLREEIRSLKERIAVLERLATDDNSGARLDREIEKLRDRP